MVQQQAGAWPGLADDLIAVDLKLALKIDSFMFAFGYGVTDRLDVGLALPLVWVQMSGHAQANIRDVTGNSGGQYTLNQLEFDRSQPGFVNTKQAVDQFDDSSFGVGDLFLRAKYRAFETPYIDGAGALIVTLPTGGGPNFRGFNDPTATPLLILSKSFGFISPHLNGGYAFRSKRDVGQAVWVAGADLRIFPWLTVAPDFLGFHDVNRKGPVRDDIIQYGLGFKLNPFKQFVWGVNFQFPMNREGLRANIIYTTLFEYTF